MATSLLPSAKITASSFTGLVPSSLRASSTSTKACLPRRVVVQAQAQDNVAKGASLVLISSTAVAGSANAIEAEQIVSAIDQVEAFASQAGDAASQAYDVAKSVTEQVVDVAGPLFKAAAPIVIDVAKKAVSAATPVASEVAGQATKALSDNGVELSSVISAAKTAASVAGDVSEKAGAAFDVAAPYAQSSLEGVLAQDPTVLAVGAGSLALLYILTPAFFGSLSFAARGYAGEFSAAQALDLLSKEDYTLIDIRSDAQKAKSGIPSLPKNAKSKLVSVAVEEVERGLRNQIRNSRKVEAEIAAIKIGALKRLGKGSRIILIDSNGELSKVVAQSLVALGFKNAYIVRDGVDGSSGWIQSRLATESGGLSLAEVLSPSRIISRGSGSGTMQVPKRSSFLLSSGSE